MVTGSRIKRSGSDTLEPATVVTDEYIKSRALTNVADALNEIPGFGVGVNTEGRQSAFGVAQNFVNRFGLGSQRTLTVVNGRRFVSTNAPTVFGNPAGLQVDLNIFPTALVDRIENIDIGGAPTYGSDAIAGTVNVILKRDVEGVTVSALSGITERGDNFRYNFSAVAGHNFSSGRGNVTLAVSYDKVNGVLGSARQRFLDAIQANNNPLVGSAQATIPGRTPANDGRLNPNIPFNTGNGDGIPNAVFIRDARVYSMNYNGVLIAPTGATLLASGIPRGLGPNNALLQFTPSGNLITYDPGIPFGTVNASGGDGLNNIGYSTQIISNLRRVSANLLTHYEIASKIGVFAEGTYYHGEGLELAAQPIFNTFLFGGTNGALLFQANDPRLTPQARATLASLGVTSFRLNRASRDLVNTNSSAVTDVYRGVLGLQGEFGLLGRRFNFEASANYGRTDGAFFATQLNQQNFVNALNVKLNASGQIVCDPNPAVNVAPGGIAPVPDPACVPLDLFGEGRRSQAAYDYVTDRSKSRSRLEQQVYNVNVGSSSLFDLWSGPVGFNVGAEYRREKGVFDPGQFLLAGLGRGGAVLGNSGAFSTREAFGELLVPLVAPHNHVPLIYSLIAEGRVRYVSSSVNGGFTAFTAGGRYEPIKGFELRGNYTRSFRSPSIVELFTPSGPANSLFPDPCDSGNVGGGSNPTVRQRNCAAFYKAYGINGTTFISQAARASVPTIAGGNPNLRNEAASSYTFGAVLHPALIPGLTAAVDWNHIRVKGPIAAFNAQAIAEGCYDNPDFNTADVDNANVICSLITREHSNDPSRNGQLSTDPLRPALRTTFANGVFFLFEGLVAQADYNVRLDGLGIPHGRIDFGGIFFYLHRLRQGTNGVTITRLDGVQANPRYAAQLNLAFSQRNYGISLQANYQSPQEFNAANTSETLDILKLGKIWTFNAGLFVNVGENDVFRLTVTNLTDRDPPFPVANGGQGTYDFLGRRYAVSLQHRF